MQLEPDNLESRLLFNLHLAGPAPISGFLSRVGLALLALASLGCVTSLGPRAMPQAGFDYNQALARSWDEQLLLNLVRLRYRDTPVFLEVGSIVTRYSFGGSAGASAGTNLSSAEDVQLGVSGGVSYSEAPSVTYTPLHGEAFVRSLLSPISTSTLVLLSRSGWSVERLLLCCVEQINGVENASAAAGPTPSYVPRYESFQRVAELMRKLQVAGLVRVDIDEGNEKEDEEGDEAKGGTLQIVLSRAEDGSHKEEGDELREIIGAPLDREIFRASGARGAHEMDEIAIVGRSLLGVLFYLSQGVKAPLEHVDAGLVTRTLDPDGRDFEWDLIAGKLLTVHSSPERPRAAAVSVFYRDHWYFIDDSDLHSKSTFNLLSYLFALKAGTEPGKEPLLVLGVN
ncbi:MAG: hypothetical protein OEM62_11055 [Acidobacteriota bacterium]|nr:hypothetical protein [Acidobacteriota bacterium]